VPDVVAYFARDHFAAHVGIALLEVTEGRARACMVIQPCHLNSLGTVHGGAIFALGDLAFAAASNSHGSVAVGISVSISYVKAATGGTLHAAAREVSLNPRLATYTVDISDDAGDMVALFQGMVYRKKESLPEPL
jgi:acyl-CoA thioesterase